MQRQQGIREKPLTEKLSDAIKRMDYEDMRKIISELGREELRGVLISDKAPLHSMIRKSSLVKENNSERVFKEEGLIYKIIYAAVELIGDQVLSVMDKSRNTLLHLACWAQHITLVVFLLEKGAILDMRNRDNRTPVGTAITRPNPHIFRLLLSRGAPFHHYVGSWIKIMIDKNWKPSESTRGCYEIAEYIHTELSSVFDRARFNVYNLRFDKEAKETPVMTLPGENDDLNPRENKFTVSKDNVHEARCSFRHILVIFAVKWVEESQQFIILKDPVPVEKYPKLNNEYLPDLAQKLKIPKGFFWRARPQNKNKMELKIRASDLDFTFIACQLLGFRVDRSQCSCK